MNDHIKQLPSYEIINRLIRYNPNSGLFFWKRNIAKNTLPRKKCGTLCNNLYIRISIKNKTYAAHRIAYLLMTRKDPFPNILDHEDNDTLNNKWDNLRISNHSFNNANSTPHLKTASGHRGVYKRYQSNRWYVQFEKNGTTHFFGSFLNKEDAIACAKINYKIFYGSHNHYTSI